MAVSIKCPVCGTPMVKMGGCLGCPNCGHRDCGG